MRLLLLDLDNTLLDREQAFVEWARRFLDEIGAPPADLDWLLDVDGDGFVPRPEVAAALRNRYGLRTGLADLVDKLHMGVVRYTRLEPLVACALTIARQAGWLPVVVSNGVTAPVSPAQKISAAPPVPIPNPSPSPAPLPS